MRGMLETTAPSTVFSIQYHRPRPGLKIATHPPKTVTLCHLPRLAGSWAGQPCMQRAQVTGLVVVPYFLSPYASLKLLFQRLISSSPDPVRFRLPASACPSHSTLTFSSPLRRLQPEGRGCFRPKEEGQAPRLL